jgi:uncharacterized membrane protein YozB (DUF420 family)
MPKGILFWVIYTVCVLFGIFWGGARAGDKQNWFAGWIPIWILVFLLGWAVFGFVVQ